MNKEKANTSTRQELAPGLVLETCREDTKTKNFYLIKVEVQHFNVIDFIVDFAGSDKITVNGDSKKLMLRQKLQPFTKTTLARVQLLKGYQLKTKFKYFIELPDIDTQRNKLENDIYKKLKIEIDETIALKDIDVSHISEEELFEFLKSKKINYLDQDFPPLNDSLSSQNDYSITQFDCVTHWRRAKFLFLDSQGAKTYQALPFLYNNGVSPSDIHEGKIGSKVFMSVLACLSENPTLVERLIINKEANEFGFYRVKLSQSARWNVVVLDNYFPCYPFGDPLFAQHTSRELWPLLLEKSYAKLYGSYENSFNQGCRQSFVDLTGCPAFEYKVTDFDHKLGLGDTTIWHKFIEWLERGYHVLLYREDEEGTRYHCTLLGVKFEESLIEIRDVLGNIDFPFKNTLEGLFKPEDEENYGKATMPFDDFINKFNLICVGKIGKWHELDIKGKLIREISLNNDNRFMFNPRWYYKLKITSRTNLTIGLHQKDRLCPGFDHITPYIDLQILILKEKDNKMIIHKQSTQKFERELFFETALKPGEYYILPFSSGLTLTTDKEKEFTKKKADDVIIKAMIYDLFEKLDITNKGSLNLKEMKKFYDYLDKPFDEKEFNRLIEEYVPTEFKSLPRDIISNKVFIRVFIDNWNEMKEEQCLAFLKRIGYSRVYKSIITRLYSMTIHSTEELDLSVQKFPKEQCEELYFINKLRDEGIKYKGNKKVDLEEEDISLVYVYDE